jgi:hypothetical protein
VLGAGAQTISDAMSHPLDNMVWEALWTAFRLAQPTAVRHYDPSIAVPAGPDLVGRLRDLPAATAGFVTTRSVPFRRTSR